MSTGRADVLEKGADRRGRPGLPRRLRPALVVVSLAAAALVLTQVDLLSSGRVPVPPSSEESVPDVPRPVARLGHDLWTASPAGPLRLRMTPTPLPPSAHLMAVTEPGTRDPWRQVLLAAHEGRLFRADMKRSRWLLLGSVDRIVSAAHVPGRVLVLRGTRLEEVEVDRGRTTDPAPFPGYDGRPWRPRGVLDAAGVGALVMSRDASDGSVELELAWPGGVTRVGQRPSREPLGRVGAFLGISGGWVLTLGRSCPGPRCELQVLRMTEHGPVTRTFAAPTGWTFVEGPVGGRPPRMLVPVRSRDTGHEALATLVNRPWPAVLVRGSRRVRPEAGLVPGPEGYVHMLSSGPGAADSVVVHDPTSVPVLRSVYEMPAGTRLVCVCG